MRPGRPARVTESVDRTTVWGILNVTPDSFSGDGVAGEPDAAIERAAAMVAAGADLIDVGAESTRPGHEPVSGSEEWRRLAPVLTGLRRRGVPFSIDTRKASVARTALALGARAVNDVSGLADPNMLALVARSTADLVLMDGLDIKGSEDPTGAVLEHLAELARRAEAAGVGRERLIVDPGFGFGKGPRENLLVLAQLGRLRELGLRVLIGTSRKSTIGIVLGGLPPEERVEGTAATVALAIANGADIVRVHDVREMVRVAKVSDAVVRGWAEPA